MPIEFTGVQGLMLKGVRELLAESATFRTLVGAADSAAAKLHIFECEFQYVAASRPYACLWFGPGFVWRGDAGLNYSVAAKGTIELWIEINSSGADAAEKAKNFSNLIDAILNDMATLSGEDSRVVIRSFNQVIPPTRWTGEEFDSKTDTSAEDYFTVAFLLEIGDE